uniref:PD-(D/E)XK nuclease family transposase n=3 Tax=Candidatus Kentrum sp. LPFa TaxID=2126335 RepID=A0A450X622_9GAMM|nr:MAG: PD-(D/E)XK nuclease family transposase [Candidatus Kentron sp. LPFa]
MPESETNRVIFGRLVSDEAAKYNRVELLARTGEGAKTKDGAKKDGELILVEVQYLSETAYLKRLAYGAAKTIVEHLKLGEPYTNVKKVYSVSLLYFDVSRDGDDYIYHGKTNSDIGETKLEEPVRVPRPAPFQPERAALVNFAGFHTHNPVTLKKSLVGDEIRVGETNVFSEYYSIHASEKDPWRTGACAKTHPASVLARSANISPSEPSRTSSRTTWTNGYMPSRTTRSWTNSPPPASMRSRKNSTTSR